MLTEYQKNPIGTRNRLILLIPKILKILKILLMISKMSLSVAGARFNPKILLLTENDVTQNPIVGIMPQQPTLYRKKDTQT